jgi:plastocyanin
LAISTSRFFNIIFYNDFISKTGLSQIMKNRAVLLAAVITAGLLFATISTFTLTNIAAQPSGNMQQGQGQGSMNENSERPSVQYSLNKKYHDYKDGIFRVRTGGGSQVAPLTLFFPNHAEIKAGETVVFYNPTRVSEPHTVTFIFDNNSFADFAAPFLVDNQTNIEPAVPNSNAEPVLMPGQGGKNVIVGVNNRSFMPTVIDSAGAVTYLPPNANYTITGTEKYVNSGWIWPAGLSPEGLPPIDSFSVTFSKPGTYGYLCEVHPWMTGDVVVK